MPVSALQCTRRAEVTIKVYEVWGPSSFHFHQAVGLLIRLPALHPRSKFKISRALLFFEPGISQSPVASRLEIPVITTYFRSVRSAHTPHLCASCDSPRRTLSTCIGAVGIRCTRPPASWWHRSQPCNEGSMRNRQMTAPALLSPSSTHARTRKTKRQCSFAMSR